MLSSTLLVSQGVVKKVMPVGKVAGGVEQRDTHELLATISIVRHMVHAKIQPCFGKWYDPCTSIKPGYQMFQEARLYKCCCGILVS